MGLFSPDSWNMKLCKNIATTATQTPSALLVVTGYFAYNQNFLYRFCGEKEGRATVSIADLSRFCTISENKRQASAVR